jgi:hypothetical protein
VNEFEELVAKRRGVDTAAGAAGGNEFDQLVEWRRYQKLDSSLLQAQDEPARAAEIERFAAERQITVDSVRSNLDTLRQQKRQDEIRAAELPKTAPVTAEFLSDPSNAAVAGNEWSLLRDLEYVIKSPVTAITAGIPRGVLGTAKMLIENFDPTLRARQEDERIMARANVRTRALLNVREGQPLRGIRPEDYEEAADAAPVVESELSASLGASSAEYREEAKRFNPVEGVSRPAQIIGGGVGSAAQTLATLPVALFTLPAIATGEAYLNATEQGMQPSKAFGYAATQGLIEYGTEKLGVESLLKGLKASNPMVKVALDFGKKEVIGEQVATVLQDFNDFVSLPENADKTINDYIAERPGAAAETLLATIAGGAAQIGAVAGLRKLSELEQTLRRDKGDQDSLDKMIDLATQSKLREVDQERFKSFLQSASGGRTVYVAQEQVQKLADTGLALPEDITKQLDGSGADVAITLRDALGNPEIAAQLRDYIRIRPGGATRSELRDGGKTLVQEIMARAQAEKDETTAIDQVAERLTNELVATGRMTQTEAATSTQLIRSYATRVLADPEYATKGLTADKLTEMLGLSVQRMPEDGQPAPAAARVLEQEEEDVAVAGATTPDERADAQREWAVNRTESPYFRRWFGDSKVMDAEGKPLVVYHGTSRSFDTFDRKAGLRFTSNKKAGIDTLGSWFTKSADTARELYGNFIVPTYLSIKKPISVDGDTAFKAIKVAMERAGGPEQYRERMKAMGYDGIVLRDVNLDGIKQTAYIAFEPEQIKSAIGNRGTFDPTDPNILNQPTVDARGVTISEEVQVAETGDTVVVERDAEVALRQTEKRLQMLRRIQECLSRG